ncbi:hypothetical protein QO200_10330 [Flavobacterium sp. Arc3]|uniref:hypothetical protein n=1 Tax=Flavobacterium sp. Arc3 TaxID=3046686 RepID=UPI00352CFDD0
METNETKSLKELRKLSGRGCKILKPSHRKKGLYTVDIGVEGYLDLLFTVANLIKVSILALDSDESNCIQIPDSPSNIKNMLEIALKVLPCDEAGFLHQSRELLLRENENGTPEK